MNKPHKQHYFLTGTDTDVGKTYIATGFLQQAKLQGLSCFGVKPVTAGCSMQDNMAVSDDAQCLKHASSVSLHADMLAPVKLNTACSPHIAAAIDKKNLMAARITGMVRGALTTPASHVLVEGAGGWFVPINARETMADIAKQLNLPVILVVGIKLGCLNHAMLSAQAILSSGLTLAGWVANETAENTPYFLEQVDTLMRRIHAPNLGVVRYGEQASEKLTWPSHS